MATIRTQISEIWRNRRIYFRNELDNNYYLISLSVVFTWVNHLWKFQRNRSGRTFKMKKYLLINFVWQIFLFFTIGQSIRLSIYVQNFRTPYRGLFENNVFLLQSLRGQRFFIFAASLKWHARTFVCWRNFHAWNKYTRSNAHSNLKKCQFLQF